MCRSAFTGSDSVKVEVGGGRSGLLGRLLRNDAEVGVRATSTTGYRCRWTGGENNGCMPGVLRELNVHEEVSLGQADVFHCSVRVRATQIVFPSAPA